MPDINLKAILKASIQPLACWGFTVLKKSSPETRDEEHPKVLRRLLFGQPRNCSLELTFLLQEKKQNDGDDNDDEDAPKDRINDDDDFVVSVDLKKKRRVAFPAGSAKQESKQAKQDQVAVVKQRAYEVDAAMVRVMKSRNVLSWTEVQLQVHAPTWRA